MLDDLPSPQEIDKMCAEAMSHCPQTHGWQREPRGFDTYKQVFEYWGSVSTLWTYGYSRYLPKSVRKFFRPDVIELYEQIQGLEEQNRRRGEALANAIPFIEFAGEEVEYAVGEAGIARILKLCKEALK